MRITAILARLKYVEQMGKNLIFISDSQTAFRSIESFQVKCKIYRVITNRIHKIVNEMKKNFGISGNEYYDSLTKG